MARPVKEGLDYYPKNTDYFNDRKVRRLLKEFGCKGFVIFDYLLCVIYQDKGYYVVYDDELAFDISDALDNGITDGTVNEVVNGCVRIGLFNKSLFDSSKVLTSSGIQKRYVLVKRTRVIDERIRVIDVETQVKSETSTQRKEKESKEKKSKGKESEGNAHAHKFIYMIEGEEIYSVDETLQKNFMPLFTDFKLKHGELKIKKWVQEFSELHNQKSWKDLQDFRHHISSYIKISSEKDNGKNNRFNTEKPKVGGGAGNF
jgi:hypothetical protein